MKTIISLAFLLCSTTLLAAPVRKALISCDYKRVITSDRVHDISYGQLNYTINLDSTDVVLNCVNEEECLLDGNTIEQSLITKIENDASFAPIREGRTVHSNVPNLIIEGSNGDSTDMFTRISFELRHVNGKLTMVAIAVLIFADEGNDGEVSAPTMCKVTSL